jgi:hypothetical protein
MGHPAAIAQRRSKGPVRQNQDALFPLLSPLNKPSVSGCPTGPFTMRPAGPSTPISLDSPLPHVDLY